MNITSLAVAAVLALSGAAPQNLARPSDDFDGPWLSGWQAMEGEVRDGGHTTFSVGDGELTVHTAQSTWFRTQHAFFLWKQVSGDFVATVRLRVVGEEGPVPTANWSLAGLLVRSSRSTTPNENWLNFTVGRVSGASVVETKSTRFSDSQLVLDEVPDGWIELRTVRIGARFFLLQRSDGDRWRLQWEYQRPDLPRVLQAGVDTQSGTDDDHADLVAHVDYIRFAPTGVPASLRRASAQRLLPYLTR
jgi:regulation of enolase protein 1 (concanavalin A-like superfamily)